MFEYINGFRKTIYWSKTKMQKHAEKYSMGYKAHKGYTFWEKDFDGMAFKTLLRQLISKWGIMSVEMEKAYTSDMAVIKDTDGTKEYIETLDNDYETSSAPVINKETGEVKEAIKKEDVKLNNVIAKENIIEQFKKQQEQKVEEDLPQQEEVEPSLFNF